MADTANTYKKLKPNYKDSYEYIKKDYFKRLKKMLKDFKPHKKDK